ncbi:MAG: family 20 glycosylhydrolase [Candidatus Aminicenantales bacterium]
MKPPLIPAPKHVEYTRGALTLDRRMRIIVPAEARARILEIAGILSDGLRDAAGVEASSVRGGTGGAKGTIRLTLAAVRGTEDPEAYTLDVGRSIEITASDPRGLLWGAQTLLQSIQVSGSSATVPKGTISDRPSRPWRGLMLDPVRSFLDLDFVRRTIRVMSACKLNVLHLHLIDDQAWRFETKAFPKCNRPGEPLYTQAELRELVAFAARYGVEIVPEFDVPGHSMTAVNAYPELDCERRPRKMDEAIFCAGRPFTWEFIDRLLGEAADVFPSAYIHLGADEPYAIKRWADCPDCRARMKQKGVTSLEALYHTFVIDLDELVRRHGKKLIVWSDAIHPGVAPMPPKDIVIDAWVDFGTVRPLAEAGYTMLNSSNGPLYLTSFGLREGLPLAAVEAWNAARFPSPGARLGDRTLRYQALSANAHILGGHASAWATEQRLTERRLYPRLLAVAENLWSEDRATGDAAEFEARYRAGFAARLRRMGVPDDEAAPMESLFTAADGSTVAAGETRPGWAVSERSYRDFRLTFELRAPAPGDHTGVFIRCAPGGGAGTAPDGFPIVAAAPPGLVMSEGLRLSEGWDRFEVVARGPIVSLTINSGLAWSGVDSAPRAGPIVLRSTGKDWQIREVRVQPLDGMK